MSEIVKFPRKKYGVDVIEKTIDGEMVEFFDIDSMTEENFRQFCKDSGTEYFQRMNITLGQ